MGATKSKWVGRLEERLGQTIQAVGKLVADRELVAQGRGKEREGHLRKRTSRAILRFNDGVRRALDDARVALGRVTEDFGAKGLRSNNTRGEV